MFTAFKILTVATILHSGVAVACDPCDPVNIVKAKASGCDPLNCAPAKPAAKATTCDPLCPPECEADQPTKLDRPFTYKPGQQGGVELAPGTKGYRFVVNDQNAVALDGKAPRALNRVMVLGDGKNPSGLYFRNSSNDGQTTHRSSSISISSDSDGNFTVTRNGKKVPADHVVRKDGTVTILKDNGEVAVELKLNDGHITLPFGKTFGLQLEDDHRKWMRGLSFGNPGDPGPIGQRGMIGITMVDVDPTLAEHLGLDPEGVVMVGQVIDGKPASRAGVQTKDIITHVDGKDSVTPQGIRKTVQAKKKGETVQLRVLRRGIPTDVAIPVEITEGGAGSGNFMGTSPQGLFMTDPEASNDARVLGLMRKSAEDGNTFQWYLETEDNNGLTHEWVERLAQGQLEQALEGRARSGQGQTTDKSIQRLEERLERLEKMLHQLLERDKKTY